MGRLRRSFSAGTEMAGNNYEKMVQDAREIFLAADQEQIIKTWGLQADEDSLYVEFFSQSLRIDRKTAEISVSLDGPDRFRKTERPGGASGAGLSEAFPLIRTTNESMVLFDMLTRQPTQTAGSWASISMLGGIIGQGHDRTLRNEPAAAKFAGRCKKLAAACEALGGRRESKADVGYSIPVFMEFCILFQFWDADDEFPASIKYLFDANALQFMHYETLWYVMNCCYERIAWQFDRM